MDSKSLSLYIHIPFCVKKCNYCDFLSAPATEKVREEYVDALCHEIAFWGKSEMAGRKVISIFFGGGTPSILTGQQMNQIMNQIRVSFPNIEEKCEITMEMNPGTVSKEKCQDFLASGINRVSIGLQSANRRELEELGRIHTYEEFLKVFGWLRELGLHNINIDIMSALPDQTIESYTETLQKVLDLQPEHISAYSLIIEEGTLFYDRFSEGCAEESRLPSENDEREMYRLTEELLEKYGYHRYEISNYAKDGYECLHNTVYWRRGDYLGLGLGSASLICNQRFNGIDSLNHYLEMWSGKNIENNIEMILNKKLCKQKTDEDHKGECENNWDVEKCKEINCDKQTRFYVNYENLSIHAQMEEFMFLGLRMMEGISYQEFKTCFGQDIEIIYGDTINKLCKQNLIEKYIISKENHFMNKKKAVSMDGLGGYDKLTTGKDVWLRLTRRGIDVSNQIFSAFLL